jgi:hypothetical protein
VKAAALAATVAALAAIACGGTEPEPRSAAIIPSTWTCTRQPLAPAPVDDRPAATVGTPTAAAAQAKRLYESEKWEAAITALGPVVRGATEDDEGNRQLAQYMLGKALYRVQRYDECVAVLRAIARAPHHLKHSEVLLWFAKLAGTPATGGLIDPSDLATYSPADVAPFDNAEQRAVYWQLSYMLGVERLRAGKREEAAALFAAVGAESPYRAPAVACEK